MARPGSVLLPPPPVHTVHVKKQRPSGYKWATWMVCLLCVVPFVAVYMMTTDTADTEPVSQASRSTNTKPVTQTETPPHVLALRTGDGRDFLALSEEEKFQLCDLIARTLKVKTSWHYFNFLNAYYRHAQDNEVTFTIPISEIAAVAAAWDDD